MGRAKRVTKASVSRLVEGLRDTGYSFEASVSDLIDNSIEAGASHIEVVLALDSDGDAIFWVADDGSGMSEPELENAMRYGADAVEDIHRLGKYGLGLKTASTSFCRELSVITRKVSTKGSKVKAATWDLDEIKKANDWVLEIGDAEDEHGDLFSEAMESLGEFAGTSIGSATMVFWGKIDRLLLTKDGREPVYRQRVLERIEKDLVLHLRMVFQRFLDPSDTRARDVKIRVNNTDLELWDPFCEIFFVKPLFEKAWKVSLGGKRSSKVTMRAFILPKPETFEDEDEADKYDKYRRTAVAARQGFFVYRENRLLEEGRWYGMGQPDTHLKALRIELNFTADADELFGVGLRKQGLLLNDDLVQILSEVVPGLRREANDRDRSGTARKVAKEAKGVKDIDRLINRRRKNLVNPELKGEGSTVDLENTHTTGAWRILDENGKPAPGIRFTFAEGKDETQVDLVPTIDANSLWAPEVRWNGSGDRYTTVLLNTSHDWFLRAYAPLGHDSTTSHGVAMLLYALALAEINNTKPDFAGELEEFRNQVSRSLRELAKDLPEHNPDD